MKRKSTKQTKSAGGRSAGKSRSPKAMGARATTRGTVSAKSNPRAISPAGKKAARKPKVNARTGRAISKAVGTLKNAVTSMKGRRALKSTSEMRAKRGSSKAATSGNRLERGEIRARSGGSSGARKAKKKQPLGTNRPVNASTKPSVGSLPIGTVQHAPVDERMAPRSDKPYAGADAFKPDAKGADTLMSAPPRKPIRQSRNQVGVRHH